MKEFGRRAALVIAATVATVGLTAIVPGQHWEPVRTKVEPAPTSNKPGGGGQ